LSRASLHRLGFRRRSSRGRPKQIIAFGDPSDLLTYQVPRLLDESGKELTIMVSLYDRNEIAGFGLLANPIKA
jgi:hypothetical protein